MESKTAENVLVSACCLATKSVITPQRIKICSGGGRVAPLHKNRARRGINEYKQNTAYHRLFNRIRRRAAREYKDSQNLRSNQKPAYRA